VISSHLKEYYHDIQGMLMLGKLLRINLSNRLISEETLADSFYRKYLGGSGFIGYFLLKELRPGIDPLGIENKLIFACGPVTGTSLLASGRNAVGRNSGGPGMTRLLLREKPKSRFTSGFARERSK
jgi:hypothetical protein